MADKTLLPTMPEVAVRMRAAMNDPKYDVGRIARIVQADAGVSAYLVRMANSAAVPRQCAEQGCAGRRDAPRHEPHAQRRHRHTRCAPCSASARPRSLR